MKSGLVILAMISVSLSAPSAQTLTCPDPMNKVHEKRFCEFLLGIEDSDFVAIKVYLPIKSESDPQRKDTVYWNQIYEWSRLLFTTYDLRNFHNQDQRMNLPPKDSIDWVYEPLRATKKTVLAMREAVYITSIAYGSDITHVHWRNGFRLDASKIKQNGFNVQGRRSLSGLKKLQTPIFYLP